MSLHHLYRMNSVTSTQSCSHFTFLNEKQDSSHGKTHCRARIENEAHEHQEIDKYKCKCNSDPSPSRMALFSLVWRTLGPFLQFYNFTAFTAFTCCSVSY
ncbi:unnamed protein product [Albugo candida]|uniref:Uncharacterized protein n=1 Tax=Albugo candida TaxID=65357 RepID=A0A024FYF1_9STRA|nr:unnamed protein product [Albugo candida]|eukprot:CCI11699.1 unnamed protein product [Albugo candida]